MVNGKVQKYKKNTSYNYYFIQKQMSLDSQNKTDSISRIKNRKKYQQN